MNLSCRKVSWAYWGDQLRPKPFASPEIAQAAFFIFGGRPIPGSEFTTVFGTRAVVGITTVEQLKRSQSFETVRTHMLAQREKLPIRVKLANIASQRSCDRTRGLPLLSVANAMRLRLPYRDNDAPEHQVVASLLRKSGSHCDQPAVPFDIEVDHFLVRTYPWDRYGPPRVDGYYLDKGRTQRLHNNTSISPGSKLGIALIAEIQI